jgi:inositol 3-alpha-galactosyltransferase
MPSPTSITLSASPPSNPLKCAYVTFLLTSPSYLPGILLLAHSLRHPTTQTNAPSAYPLIVAVNPALPKECVTALEQAGVEVRVVQPLVPRGKVTTIAERFVDTWTKLRVWEMTEYDVSLPVCVNC